MTDGFREWVEREFVVERDGWAGERAKRVTDLLQRDVPVDQRFETLIVWWQDHDAFTMVGRTIYVSRRLWERFPDDETAAFVIAHELAHHRLGHLPPATRWLPVEAMLALLERRARSRLRETDADLVAIDLCMAAGYDPERRLAGFEILAHIMLDYGDVESVVGDGLDSTHPSIHGRMRAVRAHVRGGVRFDVNAALAADRARRRRRIIAAVSSVVSVAAALLIFRRWPR